VQKILNELPEAVELVAAAKTRTSEEISEAIDAGVKIIGENYLQEALDVFEGVARLVSRRARYHFIGHLQKNKIKKAVEIFDLIETVDSREMAEDSRPYFIETRKIFEKIKSLKLPNMEMKYLSMGMTNS